MQSILFAWPGCSDRSTAAWVGLGDGPLAGPNGVLVGPKYALVQLSSYDIVLVPIMLNQLYPHIAGDICVVPIILPPFLSW